MFKRICVVGAGAMGGFFTAKLALAGQPMNVYARGETLANLKRHGIRLTAGGKTQAAPVNASDDAAALGPQDLVILAVKAQSLPGVVEKIAPLITAATTVAPILNGLPWWYFQVGATGPLAGYNLRCVDPEGKIARVIPAASLVGAVAFPSIATPEPGHIQHVSGERYLFGEAAGGESARVAELARLVKASGVSGAETSTNIRREIWLKLLGNACFNPVSLLTGSPTDLMIDDPKVYELFSGMMTEMLELGRRIDMPVDIVPKDRLAMTRKLGHIKTSMLQDMEAGRSVELDGILGSPVEVAEKIGFDAPLIRTVYAIARARSRILGLY